MPLEIPGFEAMEIPGPTPLRRIDIVPIAKPVRPMPSLANAVCDALDTENRTPHIRDPTPLDPGHGNAQAAVNQLKFAQWGSRLCRCLLHGALIGQSTSNTLGGASELLES
ncbi:hypothetical protein TWF281_006594 [Arthrobotrys megalospora]